MQYFHLVKFAQIDNFLRQRGYSPEFISFVLAKPKNLHKAIGKIINDNPNSNEDELRRLIDQLPANNLSQKPQKETVDEKLLKIFEEDGASKSQMLLFFESIPVGYHTFVKRILLSREIHPHDLTTLKENIQNYETLKKRNVAIDKNINNFATYATWVNEMSRFSDFDPDAVKLKVDLRKLKGVTLDDSMNGYEIWKVTDVESLKNIGLGTKWCTRRDYDPCQADNYLKRFGSLYVITKSGNLIAQFTADLSEIQDTKNVDVMVLPKGLNLDKYIIRTMTGIHLASEQLKNDREFILDAVKQNILALAYASPQLRNDRIIVLEAVKRYGNALEYASEQLQNDREIVFEAVKRNFSALAYASKHLQNDREIVLEAVKQNGLALEYASVQLKNDREIVFEAVKHSNDALQYASRQLRNDREIVFEAVKQNGYALKYASPQLRHDREFVVEAVKQNGRALAYASEQLKNDREIVLEAVKRYGKALGCASEQFQNDREIVFEAVKQDGNALQYAFEQLRNDREIVLEAVKHSNDALAYASPQLRNDRIIVLEAVKRYGNALRHASEQLQNDREIVFEAVKQNGDALFYASEQLRNDREIVLEAVKQYREALEYASAELQKDPDILAIVNQKKSIANGWYQRIKF